jgi:hypothetical protein
MAAHLFIFSRSLKRQTPGIGIAKASSGSNFNRQESVV